MAEMTHGRSPTLQPLPIPVGDLLTPAPAPVMRSREHKMPLKRQPAELMARAKDQLHSLIGYSIEGVSGFNKVDGGWHMSIMAVELHRIPPATDVLAIYEIKLDDGGDIISYHRGKRYFRGEVGEAG